MIRYLIFKINLFRNAKFYPRDYFFNRLVLKTINIKEYINVHKTKLVIQSPTSISFSNKINFGDSPFKVAIRIGTPFFKYERKGDYRHKIFMYKIYLGNYKAKLEYHFFNKKLFFITYSFPDLSDTKKVIGILKKKYKLEDTIDLEVYKIKDAQNNILYLDTSLEFTINYLTGNRSILDAIEGRLEDIIKNKERLERKSDKMLFDSI